MGFRHVLFSVECCCMLPHETARNKDSGEKNEGMTPNVWDCSAPHRRAKKEAVTPLPGSMMLHGRREQKAPAVESAAEQARYRPVFRRRAKDATPRNTSNDTAPMMNQNGIAIELRRRPNAANMGQPAGQTCAE